MPQFLQEGLDPTPLPCISKADVLQMVRNAQPFNGYGFIVKSDSAPNVVTTPILANFIWLKSVAGVANGEFYYYNGTSWTLLSIVNGALLADNSVPVAKVSRSGAVAYDIIQLNAAGTAWIFTSIINAIQNNSLPLAKLVNGGAGNYFLSSIGGTLGYTLLSSIVSYIATNTLPINTLIRGGASQHGLFLRTFEDGSVVEWAEFDPNEQINDAELLLAKLSVNGGAAGRSIRVNPNGTSFEWYDPLLNLPTPVYNTVSIVATTVDLSVTKPTGAQWKEFEVGYTGSFDNSGVGGNVSVAFTYQTAPESGNPVVVGAATGAGNPGQIFTVNVDSDNSSPYWYFKGIMPVTLNTKDVVAVRATVTKPGGLIQGSGVFTVKATYQ